MNCWAQATHIGDFEIQLNSFVFKSEIVDGAKGHQSQTTINMCQSILWKSVAKEWKKILMLNSSFYHRYSSDTSCVGSTEAQNWHKTVTSTRLFLLRPLFLMEWTRYAWFFRENSSGNRSSHFLHSCHSDSKSKWSLLSKKNLDNVRVA